MKLAEDEFGLLALVLPFSDLGDTSNSFLEHVGSSLLGSRVERHVERVSIRAEVFESIDEVVARREPLRRVLKEVAEGLDGARRRAVGEGGRGEGEGEKRGEGVQSSDVGL